MGDVIYFPPRGPSLDPEFEKLMARARAAQDREAQRRVRVYATKPITAQLLHVLALYPMFRLTHAKKARQCFWCRARIQPGELHFVEDGAYICQSGTCMHRPMAK